MTENMDNITIEEMAQAWLNCMSCTEYPLFARCYKNDEHCDKMFINSIYAITKGKVDV